MSKTKLLLILLRRLGVGELLSSDVYFSTAPALSADPRKQETLPEVYRRFEREQLPRLREVLGEVARSVEESL